MTTLADVRWLDHRQQKIWRSFLTGSAAIDRHLDEALRPYGLDLGEYEILVALSESEDRRMRMSELAQAARQSRSRLTHTVARMEKKGYIERQNCADDRRGVLAQLTDSGFALLEEAAPVHVDSVRRSFIDAVDPDDLEALGRAMAAVAAVAD
ncbi:MarR family winged helix-turn-helix transcriptional regulator [Nigerium massiliense]|uniref:MarR family winged helix-turn-helix transcriptional regulator n=1 Tax=Nigerium massiliense TaxID=1522317 RepID=UPI00058B3551|nr:MarR family transcriptional regulator [Nigerium massiliense]